MNGLYSKFRFGGGKLAMAVALIALSAGLLSSGSGPQFTKRDKAFYADPKLIDFVRPGLVLKVTGAEIANDGVIRVKFKITDPKGMPLDREGITTPGAVKWGF